MSLRFVPPPPHPFLPQKKNPPQKKIISLPRSLRRLTTTPDGHPCLGLGCCLAWPWLCAHGGGYLGLGAAFLGLGCCMHLGGCLGLGCCMHLGGCLGLGCMLAHGMLPWLLHAQGGLPRPWPLHALAFAAACPCLGLAACPWGGCLGLGCCMPWPSLGGLPRPWLLHALSLWLRAHGGAA